jgi:AraC family transcriptional regulator
MARRRHAGRRGGERERLAGAIGDAVARFQESSYAFDDLAAEILALERRDLPVMTALLFDGPASAAELAASLHAPRAAVAATLERLRLAGYARTQPGPSGRVELTAHARAWIERIWAPLREDGVRLLERHTAAALRAIATFVGEASAVQRERVNALRGWLALPSRARQAHLRGGLSPAALQRVQLFVEANVAEPISLTALAARAGLSVYHFSRAFKTTVGLTPGAFVEERRVERAKQLLTGTDLPIARVAAETGFGTQSRLTVVFKRRTGFTPAVYRRGRH